MKLLLALCVLSLAVTLEAAPQRLEWVELFRATKIGGSCDSVWRNCSASADHAKIIKVDITPCPPKAGSNVTVVVTFSLSESVTGGNIDVDITVTIAAIIHIPIKLNLDLCTEVLPLSDLKCPVAAGTYTYTATWSLPKLSVHVKGTVTASDQNEKELACIYLDFKA